MIRFRFLVENKTDAPPCTAEHGLSVFIETEEMEILFDAGASDMYAENAARKRVRLADADCCVISHGHYDHTGGVPLFTEINEKAPVYIHKDAFGDFYGSHGGKIDSKPCGIMWDDEERAQVKPSANTGSRKRRESGSRPRAKAPKGSPQGRMKLSALFQPPEKSP